MAKIHRPIFFTAIAAGALYLGVKFKNLLGFSKSKFVKISMGKAPDIIDFEPHLLKFGTLRIFLNVEISNPTDGNFIITHPYVQLFDADRYPVADSQLVNQTYSIPARQQSVIQDVVVELPLSYVINNFMPDSFLQEAMNIIKNDQLSFSEKYTELLIFLKSGIEGQQFFTRTMLEIDGIEQVVQEQIQF